MSTEEKTARLNLVRYGLLLVVVVAMTVTPISLFLATARVGGSIADVLTTTIIATILAGVVSAAVYFGYSSYLNRS